MGTHHFGRNFCNCLCCIFCIGPILFLVGFGLIVSSFTDFREDHINHYNAAVESWVSPDTFANYDNTIKLFNVSMSFDSLGYSSQLANNTTPESFFNDNDDKIASYNKFARFSTGLAHVQESACPDGSYYDSVSQNCDTYSIATSICVKVSQNAFGWAVDYEEGGPGCGETTWDVAGYERLRISPSTLPTVVYLDLSVRSALDPRVQFYMEMGIGAFNFGMTRGAKFATGIAMLTIGSLVLCCCVATCLRLLRLDKRHRTYDEVRAPQMVYTQQPVVFTTPPPVVYAQPVYPPQQYHQPYPPTYPPQQTYQQQQTYQ